MNRLKIGKSIPLRQKKAVECYREGESSCQHLSKTEPEASCLTGLHSHSPSRLSVDLEERELVIPIMHRIAKAVPRTGKRMRGFRRLPRIMRIQYLTRFSKRTLRPTGKKFRALDFHAVQYALLTCVSTVFIIASPRPISRFREEVLRQKQE